MSEQKDGLAQGESACPWCGFSNGHHPWCRSPARPASPHNTVLQPPAIRTPAEGERQLDYDHGYGVGYEHGLKEAEKEIEKWHRVAMEAGAITCVGGGHIYPLKDEVKQLRALVEKLTVFIKGVVDYEVGTTAEIERISGEKLREPKWMEEARTLSHSSTNRQSTEG